MSTYQMIPVPETAIPAVYQLLANLTNVESSRGQGNPVVEDLTRAMPEEEDDHGVLVEGDNGWWWPEQMDELSQMLKNPAGIAMVSTIAENSIAGRNTTYDELRDAGQSVRDEEFGYDHVRAQLSWIAKYSKKLQGENVWPFQLIDLGPDVEKATRYQYRMPEPLAQRWLEIH
jgi:hypothetical protein